MVTIKCQNVVLGNSPCLVLVYSLFCFRYALFRDWKERFSTRGSWDDSNPQIRYWSWLIGDYTKGVWFFCLWTILKKMWVSASTNMADGRWLRQRVLTCTLCD